MRKEMLESSAISAFCGSIATMLSAGIQTEEAALMLAENREHSRFQEVCRDVYDRLVDGDNFATAMEKSKGFPKYALDMVRTGESAGRLEQVLRNMEVYYDEEDRMFAKLRSSVGYPAALLVIMTVILGFTVAVILPVFASVYDNLAGSLAGGSFASVNVSMVIGWIALVVMAACAILALVITFMTHSETGRHRVMRMLEHFGMTKNAMRQLALARFTAALATLVASGVTSEDAMERAIETVEHAELKKQLREASDTMIDLDNPRSLAQALGKSGVLEPLYARMLNVGMRSGSTDEVLAQLSNTFFDDALVQIDDALDRVEPFTAALLTIAVGATLVAVMLPLVGIMNSIG